MPHGGGHFGGHHHGGGHRGGGGWHHHHHGGGHYHHHHRPYYHRGVVFTGWWFPWYYSGRRAYVGYGVWFAILFFILLIVFLSASLTTVDHNKGFDTQYSPLDTKLIEVSQTFCSSIEVENPSGTIPSTSYVLSKGPSLSESHSFTISRNSEGVSRNSYQYWYYYLHHGSSMNASICVKSGSVLEFYIIQGSSNFDDWRDGDDKYSRFEQISSVCPSRRNVNFDFIRHTDDYFFAFASGGSSSVTFDFTMYFNRTEFGVRENDVEHQCSAGGPGRYTTKCTLDVPYNDDHYFLITTGNSTSSEGYEDGAAVEWSCNARVWVYMVIFVMPPMFGMLILAVIVTVCCCRQRKRNSRYSTLINGNNAATTTTTTTTYETTTTLNAPPKPPDDLPPPYNPGSNYSQPQPPYPTGTGAYPPMSTATYPPMSQNYGTTDKPTAM
ncbi:uncharacterized protein [Dysidea avara]|uniref:uncharacterized protein n=1 Tax=Dysidea avara TaxID=196820 RepID=UPI0033177D0A